MIYEYMVTKQDSSSGLVLCFGLVFIVKACVGISGFYACAGSYIVKATETVQYGCTLKRRG